MTQKVPFFGVQREYEAHAADYVRLFQAAMATGQALQGPPVVELEQRLASLAGRKHAIAVNSCTDALYFSLFAAGVRPGDSVLVTDFSFVASASSIARCGATPVFVDIGDDYNMDFADAARRVRKNTKALVLVHLYGQMIEPARAERFCKEHGLALVEDAAQAIGAERDGRRAGSLGIASCLSFDPTKPISSIGSGGCVLTDDGGVAQAARRLRYHGKNDKGEFQELGFNSQLSTVAASLINFKLERLPVWTERRRALAHAMNDRLAGLPLRVPREAQPGSHIYHKYVIAAPDRDRLKESLAAAGIETLIHYAAPLHRQPLFAASATDDGDYARSLQCSKEVLSLPIHPFLSDEEVERITAAVRRHYGRS